MAFHAGTHARRGRGTPWRAWVAALLGLSLLLLLAPALSRAQGADSLTLSWTAPGDDGNVGTAALYELRMSTSALDANCRAHDVPNLFVADGAPFVSQADKNPTWTILALSMRTSEYITAQRRQGAL